MCVMREAAPGERGRARRRRPTRGGGSSGRAGGRRGDSRPATKRGPDLMERTNQIDQIDQKDQTTRSNLTSRDPPPRGGARPPRRWRGRRASPRPAARRRRWPRSCASPSCAAARPRARRRRRRTRRQRPAGGGAGEGVGALLGLKGLMSRARGPRLGRRSAHAPSATRRRAARRAGRGNGGCARGAAAGGARKRAQPPRPPPQRSRAAQFHTCRLHEAAQCCIVARRGCQPPPAWRWLRLRQRLRLLRAGGGAAAAGARAWAAGRRQARGRIFPGTLSHAQQPARDAPPADGLGPPPAPLCARWWRGTRLAPKRRPCWGGARCEARAAGRRSSTRGAARRGSGART